MNIGHSLYQFHGNASTCLQTMMSFQPFAQGDTLHILHHDAGPESIHVLQSYGSDYRGMLQLHHNFQFFAQHLLVTLFDRHFLAQSFQQPPPSVPFCLGHDIDIRRMEYLHIGKGMADTFERILYIARGRRVVIFLHAAKL